MNRKSAWLAALFCGCLLPSFARAQCCESPGLQKVNLSDVPGNAEDRFLAWDTHPRACCTGPTSAKPPIQTEVYFRTGPSFILGGGTYGSSLDTGWTFQGGAKAMFFNPFFDAAWYVDMSLSNSQNSAGNHPATVSLIVDDVATQATIRGLNRTFVGLGVGRAWYLWAPADTASSNLRVCWDGGGRWGTARGDFFEITHETDVIGGMYTGVEVDWEMPCRFCIFHVGARLEYGYTWSDVLQRKSDVQDINVLLQAGIRF